MSMKPFLIAAQISSVVTVIMSSTSCVAAGGTETDARRDPLDCEGVASRHAPRLLPSCSQSPILHLSACPCLPLLHLFTPRHRTVWWRTSLQIRNVSVPTDRTAAPSANIPTDSSVVRRPCRSEVVIPAASSASTPITSTPGRTRFTYAAIPASMPPPPQHTKIACSGLPVVCFRISIPNQARLEGALHEWEAVLRYA